MSAPTALGIVAMCSGVAALILDSAHLGVAAASFGVLAYYFHVRSNSR
jgi:hypothetical protein